MDVAEPGRGISRAPFFWLCLEYCVSGCHGLPGQVAVLGMNDLAPASLPTERQTQFSRHNPSVARNPRQMRQSLPCPIRPFPPDAG